ncbi:MAG: PilN domain-containing protein [Betaproteobacteria bacterium]|jgi:type IV pilus assembly protein PilN|nr:MAG: PilN domain-containing protein [Betaproteobacteria bacterium]
MIPINLLPYRAERRKELQRQFAILAALTAFIGGFVWFLGHSFLEGSINKQNERNNFLETRIAELDKKIAEIKQLKSQTQSLLARKRVVETLQSNRTESVRLLDQLVRQLPDGVHLKTIKQSGRSVSILGFATSNSRVSTLMRNFDASPWLEAPKLIEIKASKPRGSSVTLNEFNLTVQLTRPEEKSKTTASSPPDNRRKKS